MAKTRAKVTITIWDSPHPGHPDRSFVDAELVSDIPLTRDAGRLTLAQQIAVIAMYKIRESMEMLSDARVESEYCGADGEVLFKGPVDDIHDGDGDAD